MHLPRKPNRTIRRLVFSKMQKDTTNKRVAEIPSRQYFLNPETIFCPNYLFTHSPSTAQSYPKVLPWCENSRQASARSRKLTWNLTMTSVVLYFYCALILMLSCVPVQLVHAWDPNEHQINTLETTFYVSEMQEINTLVYNLKDSMNWAEEPYTFSMRDVSTHFRVNKDGQINLVRRIDYESTPKEKFSVNVFNKVTNIQEFYVNVMADVFDVNEHTPTFTHQQTERVFDTTPKVGEFVIQVTATDKDTDDVPKLQYSLENEEDNFAIDKHSGHITVKRPLVPYNAHNRPPHYSNGVEPLYHRYPQGQGHDQSAEGRYSVYRLEVHVSDGMNDNKCEVTVKVPVEVKRNSNNGPDWSGEESNGNNNNFQAISAEKDKPTRINPPVLHTPTQNNDWSTLIMASLQTPEVMIVIGLAGILLIVILIACITIMVCMNRPAGYNGMRPNRVYYYGNGTNGSMHQPPSTTNSQNITQSLYIYGDGGRLNNNRDMRDYLRP
ncbi:uncharacterized protein LOC142358585 isoform X2 [Convolutriloba macropyga]|uniref:uncharacterized protein LOC142358585 isoform X2 n=1 Tax=Convolutriloba macropyga TaxID=536237 RepID=UPI003F5229DF